MNVQDACSHPDSNPGANSDPNPVLNPNPNQNSDFNTFNKTQYGRGVKIYIFTLFCAEWYITYNFYELSVNTPVFCFCFNRYKHAWQPGRGGNRERTY